MVAYIFASKEPSGVATNCDTLGGGGGGPAAGATVAAYILSCWRILARTAVACILEKGAKGGEGGGGVGCAGSREPPEATAASMGEAGGGGVGGGGVGGGGFGL